MIQEWMKDQLAPILPKLQWTYDSYSNSDHTGTVYSEGGLRPSSSEVRMRYPNYQVWIRSSDWDYAQHAAHKVYEHFHRKGLDENFTINTSDGIEDTSYRVFSMLAVQEPIQLGADDSDIMQWSINFDVTLLKLKEATHNARI